MGMFNSIYADLRCPEKQEISRDTEIQMKWQHPRRRTLNIYHQGDLLEDLEEEYNNTWIRTDYICYVCSRHTTGRHGIWYLKVEDQQRHYVFIRIENARICEILTEKNLPKKTSRPLSSIGNCQKSTMGKGAAAWRGCIYPEQATAIVEVLLRQEPLDKKQEV